MSQDAPACTKKTWLFGVESACCYHEIERETYRVVTHGLTTTEQGKMSTKQCCKCGHTFTYALHECNDGGWR